MASPFGNYAEIREGIQNFKDKQVAHNHTVHDVIMQILRGMEMQQNELYDHNKRLKALEEEEVKRHRKKVIKRKRKEEMNNNNDSRMS